MRDTHPWPSGYSYDHGLKYAISNEVGNAGGYELGKSRRIGDPPLARMLAGGCEPPSYTTVQTGDSEVSPPK